MLVEPVSSCEDANWEKITGVIEIYPRTSGNMELFPPLLSLFHLFQGLESCSVLRNFYFPFLFFQSPPNLS